MSNWQSWSRKAASARTDASSGTRHFRTLRSTAALAARQEGAALRGLFLAEASDPSPRRATPAALPEIIAFSRPALKHPLAPNHRRDEARAARGDRNAPRHLGKMVRARTIPQTSSPPIGMPDISLDRNRPSAGATVDCRGRRCAIPATSARSFDRRRLAGRRADPDRRCADPFAVEAVRASMGAFVHRSSHRRGRPWDRFIAGLARGPGQLSGPASRTNDGLSRRPVRGTCFLLIATKQAGLAARMRACVRPAGQNLRWAGRAPSSLNAAMAAAVMAFQVKASCDIRAKT